MSISLPTGPLNVTMGVPLKAPSTSQPSEMSDMLSIMKQLVSALGDSAGEPAAQQTSGGNPADVANNVSAQPSNSSPSPEIARAIGDVADAMAQGPGSAGSNQDLAKAIGALTHALSQQNTGPLASPGNSGMNEQLADIIGKLAQTLGNQSSAGSTSLSGASDATPATLRGQGGMGNGPIGNALTTGAPTDAGGITATAAPPIDPISSAAQQLSNALQSQGMSPQGIGSPVTIAMNQLSQAISSQTGADPDVTSGQLMQGIAQALNQGMSNNNSGTISPVVANAVQQVMADLTGQGAPAQAAPAAQSFAPAGGIPSMAQPSPLSSGGGSPSGVNRTSPIGMGGSAGGSNETQELMSALSEMISVMQNQMAMQSTMSSMNNNPLLSALSSLSKTIAG